MIFDTDLQRTLVAEACLSPSVHNVQPARFRFTDNHVFVLEDECCRIPAGDPTGRDTGCSLGAATEGLALALSARGFALNDAANDVKPTQLPEGIGHVRAFEIVTGAKPDPLNAYLAQRYSHRGAFEKPTNEDRQSANQLRTDDLTPITDSARLETIAGHYDAASLRFFRDPAFRRELVSWMRFTPKHPRWTLDGLNADAMAMSTIEAIGAGVVLSPQAFPIVDKLGLAGPLTAEASKVIGSSAVLVFHRPKDEDPFKTGRLFHRRWLQIVAAGFHAAVMAALADDVRSQAALCEMAGFPEGQRVVTTWRIGKTGNTTPYKRARLNLDDLIV